jgi:hypothetical protein
MGLIAVHAPQYGMQRLQLHPKVERCPNSSSVRGTARQLPPPSPLHLRAQCARVVYPHIREKLKDLLERAGR